MLEGANYSGGGRVCCWYYSKNCSFAREIQCNVVIVFQIKCMLFLKVFCFFEGMDVDLLVVLRTGPTSNANLDEIGFSSSFTIFLSKLIHF